MIISGRGSGSGGGGRTSALFGIVGQLKDWALRCSLLYHHHYHHYYCYPSQHRRSCMCCCISAGGGSFLFLFLFASFLRFACALPLLARTRRIQYYGLCSLSYVPCTRRTRPCQSRAVGQYQIFSSSSRPEAACDGAWVMERCTVLSVRTNKTCSLGATSLCNHEDIAADGLLADIHSLARQSRFLVNTVAYSVVSFIRPERRHACMDGKALALSLPLPLSPHCSVLIALTSLSCPLPAAPIPNAPQTRHIPASCQAVLRSSRRRLSVLAVMGMCVCVYVCMCACMYGTQFEPGIASPAAAAAAPGDHYTTQHSTGQGGRTGRAESLIMDQLRLYLIRTCVRMYIQSTYTHT